MLSPRSSATRSMVVHTVNFVDVHGQAAIAGSAAAARRQFHGSNSSSRCAGCPAMRARTSANQACGSTPFIFAVTMRPYMAAARCPPRSDPQNNHDFLPKAMPRRPRSAALLRGMEFSTPLSGWDFCHDRGRVFRPGSGRREHETAAGRPVHELRARVVTWPPLRLARLRRERESVDVVQARRLPR